MPDRQFKGNPEGAPICESASQAIFTVNPAKTQKSPFLPRKQPLAADHGFEGFHDRAGDGGFGEDAFFVEVVFHRFVGVAARAGDEVVQIGGKAQAGAGFYGVVEPGHDLLFRRAHLAFAVEYLEHDRRRAVDVAGRERLAGGPLPHQIGIHAPLGVASSGARAS